MFKKNIINTIGFLLFCNPLWLSAQLFTNGDFSNGFTDWQQLTYLNNGAYLDTSGYPINPSNQSGGTWVSTILTGSPGQTLDSTTGLKFPSYSGVVARVNASSSQGGDNRNINSIANRSIVTSADLDPSDNRVHIRFAWAAVLENPPSHALDRQPFFLIAIRNITPNPVTGLYFRIEFANKNQPMSMWKSKSNDQILYTDWQIFDEVFPVGAINIGDQIEIEVMAGGCADGGHAGYVYLSSIGSASPPGNQTLKVTKSGTGRCSVTSNPSGVSCVDNCTTQTAEFSSGQNVVLTVSPDGISTFTEWSGDECTGITAPTCTVPMNANKNIVANCNIVDPPSLQVMITGIGTGSVASNPSGISCPSDCNEDNYSVGQTVNLTATPESCMEFISWRQDCPAGNTPTCSLLMNNGDNKVAEAVFHPITYALSVSKSGLGSVNSAPSAISCGTQCQETFSCGSTVELTATPDTDYVFTGWSGDCSGTSATCNLTMDSDKNIDATFVLMPTLTVSKTSGGTVTSNPAGINCGSDCSERYNVVPVVTVILTATPLQGYIFTGWSGDCSGTATTCTVIMNASKNVTATFAKAAELKIGKSGTGTGTVKSTSPDTIINCGSVCRQNYLLNTPVILTVTPDSGSSFVRWSNSCTGTNPTTTVKMSTGRYCVATFKKP